MESNGDPLNPILFKLTVGQEALDLALQEQGILPCQLHRNLAVDRMKINAWKFVQQAVKDIAEPMFQFN
jgi:hypothetical protein